MFINNISNVDLPAVTSSLNQNVSDLIYNGSVRNHMEKQPEHPMFAPKSNVIYNF